jgi:membrane protein
MTLSGWWTALKGLWAAIDERNIGLISAGIAFYAMLAIFPATAAVIAIWGVVSDPAVIRDQLVLAERFIPPDAYNLLAGQINALINANDSSLGLTTAVSLIAALWSARAGVAALIQGLNAVYAVPNRSGLRHYLAALGLTFLLIGVALVALGCIVIFPILIAFLPPAMAPGWTFAALRWGLVIFVLVFSLGVLYRYGPNTSKARVGWLSAGVIFAVLVWSAASYAFSYYLSNFGNYNQVYGSIGAVIALLMWFYISAWVVLVGAALNVEFRRQAG